MPRTIERLAATLVLVLLPVLALGQAADAPQVVEQAQPAKPKLESFVGRCVGVADGDTITVMRGKAVAKIRLHGIDSPEKTQAFGDKAKRFTSDLCFNKHVSVVVTDTDRYHRLVGLVILEDGRVLNHEIVEGGLAWWYKQYAPKDAALEALEGAAKQAKRGLWADKSPMPPWDFRARDKAANIEKSREPQKARIEAEQKARAEARRKAQADAKARAKARAIAEQREKESKAQADDSGPTVYITRTGKKYHRGSCRYLSKSKIPTSLKDAKARGYTPCKVCKP